MSSNTRSNAFDDFSAKDWIGYLPNETWSVLKSNRYGSLQRRKAYLHPSSSLLVMEHVGTSKQTTYPLSSIHNVWWSESESCKLTIFFNEINPELGKDVEEGQLTKPKVPTTGMLILVFTSATSRSMFSNSLHLLKPKINFASDCHSINPEQNTKLSFKCATLNALGMQHQTIVVLDCEKFTVAFGDESDSPVARVKDCILEPSVHLPKRVDISYPTLGGVSSEGAKILQQHTDAEYSSHCRMTVVSLSFASANLKERFLGRVRALQAGFKGTESDETLPLPSGESLNILTATWNVGEKKPPEDIGQLEDWLPAGQHDIYAIGFQECNEKKKWFKALQDHLCGESARTKLKKRLQAENKIQSMTTGTDHDKGFAKNAYVLLSQRSLWGIHLVTIVRSDIKKRITHLSSSTEATGIAHILGNKGGVATGFIIDGTTSLGFVTCHLAARVTRLHIRQENYEEIVNGVHIEGNAHGNMPVRGMDFLHTFDHVFWFGDLNYRVDMGNHGTEKEYKKVVGMAMDEDQRYELNDHDQLRKQMHSKTVMCDFEEGAIDFAPTYRMLKGKDGYSNKKHQNPSYCDRVLWKSLPGAAPQLYQTLYSSAPTLNQSDHRPVLASFAMNAREPYIARGPISSDGAKNGADMLITCVTDLKFTISDETSNPKAKRAVKFDGYSGPACVTFTSCFYENDYATAPTDCSNPAAAKAFHKKSSKSKGNSSVSETDLADSSETVQHPEWCWDNRDIEDMFPVVADCEWLATQSISAVVRRGIYNEAPIIGQCEIPLDKAFEDLIKSSKNIDEGEVEEDEDADDGAYSTSAGGDFRTQTTTSRASVVNIPNSSQGAPFRSHVLRNGKYLGVLSGNVSMTYIQGISEEEDEADIAEKLILLKRSIMGLREKRTERIAATQEAPETEKVVTRTARQESIVEEEKKIEEVEIIEENQRTSVAADTNPSEGVSEEVVEEPVLLRIGGKANNYSETLKNDSDNEDDEDDEDDEDLVDLGPEVWFEDDEVVARSGKRWFKSDFICVVTAQNLCESDFILKDDEPFSRVGYLQTFGLHTLCAHCLKHARKDQNCLYALGFKWHAEHLKCAHSGQELPISDPILVKNKTPYNEESYVELFHTCPKCLDVVPINSGVEQGVQALNQIWHRGCFNCDSCEKEFPDGKFFARENKEDGRGKMPYCEECYKTNFMPRCLGCNDHVLLDVEDTIEACGGYWHPDHFRCAATGVKLAEEYMSRDGHPYSIEGYFETFGEKCTKCDEVMKDSIVSVLGRKWHPECFVCTSSNKPIPKNDDGMYVYFAHELMPYCEEEYARLFGETCARCNQAIVSNGVEALGEHWHEDCLTCQSCTRPMSEVAQGKPIYQGPEDGMPYCLQCYGRKFGDACAACKFPINPGEVPVEALGKVFHKNHFCCVKCHKDLYDENDRPLEFFPHKDYPFCRECYLDCLCSRCIGCGLPIKPEDDALTLQDGKGNNTVYHRGCHRCFITNVTFKETDAIYMNDGFPYCENAYKEVFADHVCSGCGDGILGARQVALDKSWHPGHICCASCDKELASNEIFVREEAGMDGGKWPVCQEHMAAKFEALSEKGQKKLRGDEWNDWADRQAKARQLNEDNKLQRDSLLKERSLSEGDRSESVRMTLASPFSGFEKQMREAMGIVVKKRNGSSTTTVSEVTSADTSIGKAKPKAELDREAKAWVKLQDNQGYDYYWNTFTDSTTYEMPESFEEPDKVIVKKAVKTKEGKLWCVLSDPNGAGDYYQNKETGETQWDKPDDLLEDEKKPLEELDIKERESVVERASEWSVLTDDNGSVYYQNDQIGLAQWEKPTELELLEEIEESKEEEEEREREEQEKKQEEEKAAKKKREEEEAEEEEKEKKAASEPVVRESDGSVSVGPPSGPPPVPVADDERSNMSTPPPPPPPRPSESSVPMSPSTAVERLHVNDGRRPSKIKIENTMNWSQSAVVMDQQNALHKAGYLKKKGGGTSFLGRRNWNSRYFVLSNSQLSYYKSDKEFKNQQAPIKGSAINLTSSIVTSVDSDKYPGEFLFTIKPLVDGSSEFDKEISLLASSQEERQGWVNLLKMSSGTSQAEGLVL
ncbi:hypothetical protein TrST_g11737 [Triparma strigata]|uniref:Uncharacterized protein n=1 Tax=Triparma strigata TaxID=1606541 RepID=A0A9W7C3J0_9STRA|nr:hypothetical protein TrST_g11737 [Triparma strigata]